MIFLEINAQKENSTSKVQIQVTDNTVVRDEEGTVYQAWVWKKLLLTGYYYLKAENPGNVNSSFLLIRMSEEERKKKMSSSPKPKESKNFVTGQVVKNFSTTDINGKKIKLKDLKGSVVVINFWFINCPPCREEISELNKIVEHYKDSSGVIFLGIALDEKDALEKFLQSHPFDYRIIDQGRTIAGLYGVSAYPTHLVIDKEGKAYFHTAGGGSSILYWLQKSIEEALKVPVSIPSTQP